MRLGHSLSLGCLASTTTLVRAINLDLNSTDSVLSASKTIVQHILGIYGSDHNTGIGLFPSPYYFWEDGLAFNSLLNYWAHSGDDSIVPTIQDALLAQAGDDYNYLPANQTKNLGNDDQAFWALAAMTAAETGLPARDDQNVTWLQLAQNVFDSQVVRWDDSSCRGGLRWQIFSFNSGYNYKNSAAQGTFINLAARLARYTGNSTYSDWARNVTQWTIDVGLFDLDTSAIYDGTETTDNCSLLNHLQWTYTTGLFIDSSAYLLNATNAPFWNNIAKPLVAAARHYFTKQDGVLFEVACEPNDNCSTDQLAYRSVLARALANVRDLAPASDLKDQVNTILQASAMGAAAQCSGGSNDSTCGSNWLSTTWDGSQGLGQDLSALEVILANMPAKQLYTNVTTAATASGDKNATGTASATPISQTGGAAALATCSTLGSFLIAGVIGLLLQ